MFYVRNAWIKYSIAQARGKITFQLNIQSGLISMKCEIYTIWKVLFSLISYCNISISPERLGRKKSCQWLKALGYVTVRGNGSIIIPAGSIWQAINLLNMHTCSLDKHEVGVSFNQHPNSACLIVRPWLLKLEMGSHHGPRPQHWSLDRRVWPLYCRIGAPLCLESSYHILSFHRAELNLLFLGLLYEKVSQRIITA